MKLISKLLCITFLSISMASCLQQKEQLVTLDGKPLIKNDTSETEMPYLQIKHSKSSKGVIVFYPSSGQGSNSMAKQFNQLGYSVATLKGESIDLKDAIKAFRLIKTDSNLKLNTDYTCIVGYSDSGKLAALTVNELDEEKRPNDLILINPASFNETTQGTVFPLINPPINTKTKLLCIADTVALNKTALKASQEYTKTWIGYDGVAFFKELGSSDDNALMNGRLIDVLTSFWNGEMASSKEKKNPAAIPVEGYSKERHAAKLDLIRNNRYNLLFIGNSITNNLEKPEFRSVWNKYFGSRNAINLGYSGYRTENIIWNIKNGELENQSPKVIILEIGTNNVDEKNYPTRHTANQLAGGIEEIVKIFREKCPDSKIILLRCFPGSYDGPNPTSHRRILERASDIVAKLADNEHVFYCDVNHVFLNIDGSINRELMPDWLHPNPKGAELWAQAMEPQLSDLMEDKSKDDNKPINTAIVPTPKLEDDSYDWWERHNDVLNVKDSLNPEIVLIGNSITHFWGGKYPPLKFADGSSREPNGPNSWSSTFENLRVLNLGFGWDRTQNVLWRLDNGELDGLNPRLVIIHIGTNNTSETNNARMNSASEIIEGIEAICIRVRSKIPSAKIVLMQIMPREEKPDHPRRKLINETNQLLKKLADKNNITLLDISSKMLTSDGILTKELTFDYCHPTDAGYQIWGNALRPYIDIIK